MALKSRLRLYICLLIVCVTLAGCADDLQPVLLDPATTPEWAATSTTPEPAIAPTAFPTTIPTATSVKNVSLAGSWVGGFQLPGGDIKEQRISLTITEVADRISGQIELPLNGTQAQLSTISSTGGNVSFTWESGAGKTSFTGRVEGHTLSGSVQRGTEIGSFAYVQTAEPLDYTSYTGTYRFPSGDAIGFYEPTGGTQVFPTRLMFANLQTGDLGAAFPVGDDTFAIGPVIGLAYPIKGEVKFVRDAQGGVSGLIWKQPDSPELTADKVSVTSEEVTYTGGDGVITLAGRLITPHATGKVPVVIIVHGAGEVTRKNFLTDMLAGMFAANGIATFSYDKRGVGDSGGTYVSRGNASQGNIELLASDALAGVNYLKGRPEIDATQIGMQGNSQAGWIIPFAAAQSKDVAFMIMWSGPGVTQGITDTYDRLAEGMDPEELAKTLRETPPFGFDPVPSLEVTTAPGFWAFGSVDKTVPVPESIASLEKVKAAGQKDFTWQVFPNGDHFLISSGSAPNGDLRLATGYVPGLLGATMAWLKLHIHTN